jgi:hypothetical protein
MSKFFISFYAFLNFFGKAISHDVGISGNGFLQVVVTMVCYHVFLKVHSRVCFPVLQKRLLIFFWSLQDQ